MKVFLGADHGGYALKNVLAEHLLHAGANAIDMGAKTLDEDDDFPRYAYAVAVRILGEEEDEGWGILICRSGQGMAIAANRVRGIRATLAWSEDTARSAKRDDNSNVLVLAGDFVDQDTAIKCVDAWLSTKFSDDPRYTRRLDELEQLYG